VRWLLSLLLVAGCKDDRAQAAFDRYRQPGELVAALAIQPGDTVADVGAGSGYLTHRLAAAAGPRGKVVATDIDFAALQKIGPAGSGEAPIEIRVVRPDDPSLEAATYRLILLSQVDHLLPDRADYLRRLSRALVPGGRIAVTNRRLFRAPLLEAAGAAGLRVANEHDRLPAHFLIFLESG
jgi:predicted methyltransferase